MSKTITLELPDDLAALIEGPEAQAEARAQAIEAIRDRFATAPRSTAPAPLTREQARAALRQFVPADRPVLPAEALTREAMYED